MLISYILILFFFKMFSQENFTQNQKNFPRVKEAFSEKEMLLRKEFKSKGLRFPPREILMISYKEEDELQIWVKDKFEFELFKVYKVCEKSGYFGPKRKQGDQQVPEGFYKINVFNPTSSYHLSLGINYPNQSDTILGTSSDLGGDIYIHGGCVSVGCLPMEDEIIKEIYVLNTLARNNGQIEIPIYLFPFKFNKLTEYIYYKENPKLVSFWNNIKSEYYYFKENKRIRNYTIDSNGKYVFY